MHVIWTTFTKVKGQEYPKMSFFTNFLKRCSFQECHLRKYYSMMFITHLLLITRSTFSEKFKFFGSYLLKLGGKKWPKNFDIDLTRTLTSDFWNTISLSFQDSSSNPLTNYDTRDVISKSNKYTLESRIIGGVGTYMLNTTLFSFSSTNGHIFPIQFNTRKPRNDRF